MSAACITGTPTTVEGSRHAFGVSAFQSNVPPHLVRRFSAMADGREKSSPTIG